MDDKLLKTIAGILLIGFCVGLIIYNIYTGNQLDRHHVFGIAYTHTSNYGGRSNPNCTEVNYTILVNGKEYKGSSIFSFNEISASDCNRYLLGRTFPVIYTPGDPTNSQLMVTPRIYRAYGETFPDSLQWVLQYLKQK